MEGSPRGVMANSLLENWHVMISSRDVSVQYNFEITRVSVTPDQLGGNKSRDFSL